jgi:hypothetical protein
LKSRLRNVTVGAAVLVAGVVGLFLPISAFDGGTSTVGCGNAVAAAKPSANAANMSPIPGAPLVDPVAPRPDLVAACDSAISGRRHWAIPLVIVGAAGILAGVVVRGHRQHNE